MLWKFLWKKLEQMQMKFKKQFKKYDETKTYNEYEEVEVEFDPAFLELESATDIHKIMEEVNKLSYKLYFYGFHCDEQVRVVQQVEDEFEKWKATIYSTEKMDDKQFKTEKSKERFVMVKHGTDYWAFHNAVSAEKYKLSLFQRVLKALESYGYKLHDLKDYNLAIERNS